MTQTHRMSGMDATVWIGVYCLLVLGCGWGWSWGSFKGFVSYYDHALRLFAKSLLAGGVRSRWSRVPETWRLAHTMNESNSDIHRKLEMFGVTNIGWGQQIYLQQFSWGIR